jgi:hypothetical protein
MDDEKAHGERVAGHVVMLLQLVSWAAFLGALGFAGEAFSKPEYATPAAVMMVASALGFGLLANAVLRR